MKRSKAQLLASVTLLLTLLFSHNGFAQSTHPDYVSLPGTFQAEYGCGIWAPECPAIQLTETSEGLWEGTFIIAAGYSEYKVAYNKSWGENYGEGGVPNGPNMKLTLTAKMEVHFLYSEYTHLVTVTKVPPPETVTVILAGSFQSYLGCPMNWVPDCPATKLYYDGDEKLYKAELRLPAGSWQYKVTIGGSWDEDYGEGGEPGGANITLNLPIPGRVVFAYNHSNHQVSYIYTPDTVVIPGSFQNELGCLPYGGSANGDWRPDCDATRLTYDAATNSWSGTFLIPAGDWAYKVAVNNSWGENYGDYGIPGGSDIHLPLKEPTNITFVFDQVTHQVTLKYDKADLCVVAFYDANVNGIWEPNETQVLAGAGFTLPGENSTVQYTGSDGTICYNSVPAGSYTVRERTPSSYLLTSPHEQTINLERPETMHFGYVCLGGAGAQGLSFWMTKLGQAAFDSLPGWKQEDILFMLRMMNLRNAAGENFDPWTYEQLRVWMQKANAKNMAYKLSAEMAALYLNAEVKGLASRTIYTPGMNAWGWQSDFTPVYSAISYVGYWLWEQNSFGGEEGRAYHQALRKLLEDANADKVFVQLEPCSGNYVTSAKNVIADEARVNTLAPVVWPNPSGAYFRLRPAQLAGNGELLLRVLDVDGKLVYTTSGSTAKEYRFGEGFKPGMYFVEITQGSYRSTIKVVKQ